MTKAARRQPSQELTKKEVEDAAGDARFLMEQSPVIRTVVSAMIVSRRLYMAARSALDNELQHRWETDNPGLIVETLVASAQEKSNEKFGIADLIVGLLGTALPFLNAVADHVAQSGMDIDGTRIFSITDEPDKDPTQDG